MREWEYKGMGGKTDCIYEGVECMRNLGYERLEV